MSRIYDNWERLVTATLRREQLRISGQRTPSDISSASLSSSSFNSSSGRWKMEEVSKGRLVRCPKCKNVLRELPDFPVYQCGGCGAILRAKNRGILEDRVLETSDEERDRRLSAKQDVTVDMKANDNDSIFSGLLIRLEDKYQQLSLVEKKNIHEKLFELVDGEFSLSYEPNIQRSRGRPPIGKKRTELTSTVRDPSQFEIVEASLKQITHKDEDYYSQTSQSTTTVLNEELISTFLDERGSMNFVDLNANSSSYDEF